MSRGPVPAWLNAFPLGMLFPMLATGPSLFVPPFARPPDRAATPAD